MKTSSRFTERLQALLHALIRIRQFTLLALFVAGMSTSAIAQNDGPRSVIRTLTWNTWLLPDLLTGTTLGGMNNDDRIHHIAARLNTEKYDVVVLNEVWINIEDPISDPTETNSDFIYLLTHHIPNSGASSAADLEDRYSNLSALPGEKPKAATGQYPHYVWLPAFHHDLLKMRGDAGLMVLTQFPPLPRKLPAGFNTWHLSYMSVDNPTNFFCFGKGQQNFESDADITFAPWTGVVPYPLGLSADAYTGDIYLMDELRSPTLIWSSFGFKTFTDDECAGAYAWFRHKGGDDARSSKGVGWIRVMNTKTNRPLNIFFTHTQGDYVSAAHSEEHVAERKKEMEVIRSFIQKMAPEREDILLMGDLNILGDSQLQVNETVPTAAMKAEYDSEIGGNLANMGFEDTFRKQLRPTDKDYGWTRDYAKNDNNGTDDYKQRLDYILAKWHANPSSWMNTPYCVQHVRVRRDFDSLNDSYDSFQVDADISDHWPVEMTWGIDKGYCSPVKAFDFATIPFDQSITETILQYAQRGALQWLRIPANSDVVVTADLATGTGTTTVVMHPFKATDISMPLKQFAGPNEQGAGGVRDLNNGIVLSYPFDVYVRVMATQAGFTGSGKIRITRLDGTSFEKAVPIGMTGYPTSPRSDASYGGRWANSWSRAFAMAAMQFAQPAQQFMWFRFNADVRSAGAPHCVTINLMQEHILLSPQYTSPPMPAPRSYKFALYNAQAVPLQPSSAPVSTGNASDITPFVLSWSCAAHPKLKFNAPAENLRILVNRGVASDAADPFRINITNDKRGMRFKKLDVAEDDDASATDEPVAIHNVDGDHFRLMSWNIDEGGAVTNWNAVIDGYPAGFSHKDVQFSSQASWKIGENDEEGCDDCWDGSDIAWFYKTYNGTYYWHHVDFSQTGVSSSSDDYGYGLSLTRTQSESSRSFDRALEWVPGEGHYRLRYEVYMPGGVDMEPSE